MIVSRVRMTNVRSRHELEVEFGQGLTILVGPNGAGKTTVMEAVALVLEGTPLRAAGVKDLISKDQGHLRVEVDLEDAGMAVKAAAAYSRDGERRLTADGAALADSSRWREALPVRTFVPDDLRLIKGSPRRRREYLDTLAARCEPGYSVTLRRYEETLAQRNSLLRVEAALRAAPSATSSLPGRACSPRPGWRCAGGGRLRWRPSWSPSSSYTRP